MCTGEFGWERKGWDHMAGAGRTGCARASARERRQIRSVMALSVRIAGGEWVGGQAGERVNGRPGRPGARAGRHAGGSAAPWGCGRAGCTGLVRACQRACWNIATPDESLTRTNLSQPPSLLSHPSSLPLQERSRIGDRRTTRRANPRDQATTFWGGFLETASLAVRVPRALPGLARPGRMGGTKTPLAS